MSARARFINDLTLKEQTNHQSGPLERRRLDQHNYVQQTEIETLKWWNIFKMGWKNNLVKQMHFFFKHPH
jgi:hypothetical protein